MKHRAIGDLSQLNETQFLREISTGLELIYENATQLNADSHVLASSENFRGHRVLSSIALEESAKYLILLDAVRCPCKDSANRGKQLAKFNDHLAKGVYIRACDWRPDTFGALSEYVRMELDKLFLDGPQGVDWIFRNQILAEREEACYVDYVMMDGDHHWISPKDRSVNIGAQQGLEFEPAAMRLMKAAHRSGIAEMEALKIFAGIWRGFGFDDDTHYQNFRTINYDCWQKVWAQTEPRKLSQDDASVLVNYLPFPMYSIDMKIIEVDRRRLQEAQDNWSPG